VEVIRYKRCACQGNDKHL